MARKLRVLTIGHSYCVGANRALAREVARHDDFDVTVAAPRTFHGDFRWLEIDAEPSSSRVRLVPLETRLTELVHLFSYENRALVDLVRRGRFDVVHAWQEPYILSGYQIARALGPSSARFCFRTAQNKLKRYPPPFSLFERHTVRRAQGWIAGASLVRDAMLERGFAAASGRVLNPAVDLDTFRPIDDGAKRSRQEELGLSGPVIGFVGRLTEAKGLDVLMAALNRVGTTRPWSVLFLGSGEYEPKIEKWAAERGLRNRVKVQLVAHFDVPQYVAAMDLIVAPSQTMRNWREQFGRMLIEAFACGVPVVGSDSGEIPFVIGDAGIIVGEKDVAGWARAIESLLDDPAKRDALKARGLERAKRYSVEAVGAQYRDFYRWLAEQPLERHV